MTKIIAALVVAAAFGLLAPGPAMALVEPGLSLPEMTLPDTDGQPHELTELTRGKVAVLVYWSISCPHCRVEIPHLVEMNKRLTGNPFVLLSINGDGMAMAPAAAKMAERFKLPEPFLVDTGPGDSLPFADAFDVIATPTVLVFNPEGKLTHAQELKVDMESLTQAVREAF